jgi:radical SAM superfamily enzyme YgiQ (UPF0313 family)
VYRLRQDVEAKLKTEIGTCYKATDEATSVALVYPNIYAVGMANLGVQTIYGYLNARDDVRCERAFLPDKAMLPIYEQTGAQLFSYESQQPLTDFDIVAFSISFENDYLNILKILQLARIPLKTEERPEGGPLILAGGAVTTINPEPLAMFIDLFIVGDGEAVFEQFFRTYKQVAGHESKQAVLEALAEVAGVYAPAMYAVEYDVAGHITRRTPTGRAPETIEPGSLTRLDDYPAYSRILTANSEFGDMFLLQINRGCAYKCRFCHTGYGQSPLRHLSLETARRIIRRGLHYRDRIGLVGAALADHPHLPEICDTIMSEGGRLSVSSLRVSALSKARFLLKTLTESGQKTVALAPEAGTERLRSMLHKALPNTLLYEMIEQVIQAPIPHLKLYFLVGLPTETSDDIDALIEVCKKCRHLMLKTANNLGKIAQITISVNPFVPKPFTPLQWCAMDSESRLKRKIQRIKRAVRRLPNMDVIHEVPKWAVWQGILACGDRKMGHVLLLTFQYGGDWKRAFRELNLHPGFYAHRERGLEETFPWAYLNVGGSHRALADEYLHIIGGQGEKRED